MKPNYSLDFEHQTDPIGAFVPDQGVEIQERQLKTADEMAVIQAQGIWDT